MGQLRTANKRHKRAVAALQKRKVAAKDVSKDAKTKAATA
jgi:hypothetical protein